MWALLTGVFFGVALTAHALACRLFPERNRVILFLLAGGIVGMIMTVVLYLNYGWLPQAFAGVVVYAFCCELYIFLFASTLTSISANLLLRLSKGGMTHDEIARVYDSSDMVKQRVARMISTGLILVSEDSALTYKGHLLLRVLQSLRRFFHQNRER